MMLMPVGSTLGEAAVTVALLEDVAVLPLADAVTLSVELASADAWVEWVRSKTAGDEQGPCGFCKDLNENEESTQGLKKRRDMI